MVVICNVVLLCLSVLVLSFAVSTVGDTPARKRRHGSIVSLLRGGARDRCCDLVVRWYYGVGGVPSIRRFVALLFCVGVWGPGLSSSFGYDEVYVVAPFSGLLESRAVLEGPRGSRSGCRAAVRVPGSVLVALESSRFFLRALRRAVLRSLRWPRWLRPTRAGFLDVPWLLSGR